MKKGFSRMFGEGVEGMITGLFCTLILGTIFVQWGIYIPGWFGKHMIALGNVMRTLCAAGIGAGIVSRYNTKTVVSVMGVICALIGAFSGTSIASYTLGSLGIPLGAYLGAVLSIEIGQLISDRVKHNLVIVPFAMLIVAGIVGYFVTPYLSKFMWWLASVINYNVGASPVIGGVVTATLMCILVTSPVGAILVASFAGLSGLAGGAACVGACAAMIGFAVGGYYENGMGGLVVQAAFTPMVQFLNVVRRPLIIVPPLIASAILGPVSTAVLKMSNNSVGAAMGTSGFVGQICAWNSMALDTPPVVIMIELMLMHFLLPGIISYGLYSVMRKLGWIKKGEMRIQEF